MPQVVSASSDGLTQETLLRSPFHQFLKLKLVDCADGRAEMILPFREDFLANPANPYIHGGVIASLLDVVGDYAVASQLGHGVPTIDMRVDFLRPAGREDLVARASVVRSGRTVAVADAEVRNPDGKLIAIARLLYGTARPAAGANEATTEPG